MINGQVRVIDDIREEINFPVTNELEPEDFVALEDFMMEAITADPANLSAVNIKDLYREMEQGCVFIAKDGDRIVGMVRAVPMAGYRVISTTYVHPEFQRQGIGESLIDNVISYFENEQFYLETQSYPMVCLANRKLGFHMVDKREVARVIIASNWAQMTADPIQYFKGFFVSGDGEDQNGSREYVFMVREAVLET